jgi:hypothetical protein
VILSEKLLSDPEDAVDTNAPGLMLRLAVGTTAYFQPCE